MSAEDSSQPPERCLFKRNWNCNCNGYLQVFLLSYLCFLRERLKYFSWQASRAVILKIHLRMALIRRSINQALPLRRTQCLILRTQLLYQRAALGLRANQDLPVLASYTAHCSIFLFANVFAFPFSKLKVLTMKRRFWLLNVITLPSLRCALFASDPNFCCKFSHIIRTSRCFIIFLLT